MNILFVCRANVGRSQMAAALYNNLYPDTASSAGTAVDEPGQFLSDRPGAKNAIEVMHELGIDISKNERTQLYEKDQLKYDLIVVMTDSGTIPDFLKQGENVEFWDVDDPRYMDLDETRKVRDLIKSSIDKLIAKFDK